MIYSSPIDFDTNIYPLTLSGGPLGAKNNHIINE